MSKPRVLVLGGAGFIGRNLTVYLIENDLASKVRVVDKVLPQTAYLTKRQEDAFAKAEFKQGNLVSPASIEKSFTDEGGEFDYVFNCAAETKYGQTEQIYEERVYQLTVNCAKEAAKRNVKRFVEISTGQVYSGDKKHNTEDDKTDPWTLIAKAKLKAEQELAKIPGLNYVIVRPAVVYGVSDVLGVTPRLIIGAVYKHLNETMKLLWTEKLRIATVHIDDVVRALWFVRDQGKNGEIYNLADKADSTQDSISKIIAKIFGIKHDYLGSIMSNLAKVNMKGVTEEVNEKHMQPWSEMCRKDGIENTPLSPYLDQELLYNNSLSLDGSKIEKAGFKYEHPEVNEATLRSVVQEYVNIKAFPKSYFS
eukprot:Opistho-1_new@97437